MRDLEEAAAAGDARARTAIDVYVASIRHWLGAGIVELGGLDGVAFAGGIGENSPLVRAAVLAGLEELGIRLDPAANAPRGATERPIHAADSRVAAWVIPTNEELIVARQARDLLADGTAHSNPGGG
jgi:acetate kinase